MSATLTLTRETSWGHQAHKLRLAEHVSRQRLAHLAGVTVADVALFERSLPVPMDYKRRILRALWAIKKG
jgi:DNA-binding transcriptional regulator YiaG